MDLKSLSHHRPGQVQAAEVLQAMGRYTEGRAPLLLAVCSAFCSFQCFFLNNGKQIREQWSLGLVEHNMTRFMACWVITAVRWGGRWKSQPSQRASARAGGCAVAVGSQPQLGWGGFGRTVVHFLAKRLCWFAFLCCGSKPTYISRA